MSISIDFVQKIPAFQTLPKNESQILAQNMIARSYQAGQFIFFEGDETSGLWFILEGTVRIIKQSKNGRQQGLCTVNSGKCFGTCPLFDQGTNPADAQALSAVKLAILPRSLLNSLIYQNPILARSLLQIYTDRLGLLARLGECLGTWTVGQRINDCLLAYAQDQANSTIVELSHDEIATFVGTAREVVSRHLVDLETKAIIRSSPRRITLLDMQSLNGACLSRQGL
jgi:CRP-like cAMP-binding protein